MVKEFVEEKSSASPKTEPDVVALVKKMQQQLVFLEKKIDVLINQSSSRPSRPFGRPHRFFNRERGDDSGEKRFDHGRYFEKRHSEENQRFDHKKKVCSESRENDFGQDRRFARRHDSPKGGFGHKKKPFPFKRKGRSK